MSRLATREFYLEVAKGNIPGHSIVNKFGRNPDVDTGGFEAIWNGGGDYTGHDAIVAETLTVASSAVEDVGTVLSSGTATGGSKTTLVDSGATFVSDGGAIGDVLINDSIPTHGIVTAIAETTLTFLRMHDDETNAVGNTYRLVTQGSTGASCVHLQRMLDGNFASVTEYVVLNGQTAVDTSGTFLRQARGRVHGGAATGNITCRQKTTTANIMMVLPTGYDTTMIAADTIPAGKTGYLIDVFAGLAKRQSAFSNLRLMIREVNDVYRVAEEWPVATDGTTSFSRNYNLPKDGLPQMSDLKLMADTNSDNTVILAGFDLLLVDDGF